MKAPGLAIFAIVAAASASGPPAAYAQARPVEGKADAGRATALLACTGCHIVTADQPFKPLYSGPPRPPDFKDIANRTDATAASLRHHLETLPAVPANSHMPNPMLSSEELRDVATFIIGLREPPAAPAR